MEWLSHKQFVNNFTSSSEIDTRLRIASWDKVDIVQSMLQYTREATDSLHARFSIATDFLMIRRT